MAPTPENAPCRHNHYHPREILSWYQHIPPERGNQRGILRRSTRILRTLACAKSSHTQFRGYCLHLSGHIDVGYVP